VNNAAQTVRRPPAFYEHLRAGEERPLAELPASLRPLVAAPASQLARTGAAAPDPAFPAGRFDLDDQQIDLRPQNSWRLTLAEVSTVELLEVHLVNAVAPFLLTARLKPLMMRGRTDEKHVIHVSAMEAQFARTKKTDKHPHTNMAKAALNMMTRTSAGDYARDGIFMNSVDTGWITDEDPLPHVARKQVVHDFHPPLDAVDGAARVLDPLFSGLLTGRHVWGLFLKDYRPTSW
jgi:NAD(P)-dependent dehydrogenase (short-subunit alcohol dehydrogenase family)